MIVEVLSFFLKDASDEEPVRRKRVEKFRTMIKNGELPLLRNGRRKEFACLVLCL